MHSNQRTVKVFRADREGLSDSSRFRGSAKRASILRRSQRVAKSQDQDAS